MKNNSVKKALAILTSVVALVGTLLSAGQQLISLSDDLNGDE